MRDELTTLMILGLSLCAVAGEEEVRQIGNLGTEEEGWIFYTGRKAPRAKGAFTIMPVGLDAPQGRHVGRLSGDFENGGTHVASNLLT